MKRQKSTCFGFCNLNHVFQLLHNFASHIGSIPELSHLYLIFHREVGKVIGGTKGNAILDFVSGAPVKAYVKEDAPNVFDYDELSKYGFGVSDKLNSVLLLSFYSIRCMYHLQMRPF